MAKSTDRPEERNDTSLVRGERDGQTTAGGPAGQAMPGGPTRPQQQAVPSIDVDESHALASYANFCRVTGTPEEVIIDFGVNAQPFGPAAGPIPVTQRIITNYYTAKRLLQVLQITVQRHEAAFGVLETDVQKRAMRVPQAGPPGRV